MSYTDVDPVPPGWEVVALDECCSFASGGTPSKSEPENWNGSIPWASPKDLKRLALSDTQDHISELGLQAGSKLAPAGSVFVVVRGMILAREVPVALAAVPMAFNQDLKAVIPGDRVHSEFLLYALQTNKHQLFQRIGRSAHGTRTLLSEDLASFRLPLPPKAEQRAIATVVGMVGRAMEIEDRLIATTRELKRAAMQQLFTRGLRGEPERETEIGSVPESWRLARIQDLARVRGGKRLPKGEALVKEDTGFPYIRVTDFRSNTVDASDVRFVPRHVQQRIARYVIEEDDIYLSIAGTVGLVGMAPRELLGANLTENAARLTLTDSEVLSNYLMRAMDSEAVQSQFRAHTAKNAQPKLALTRIEQVLVPIPADVEAQRAIVAILDTLDSKVDLHERRRATLRELFDTLLHDLMTGRLRVDDLDLTALEDRNGIKTCATDRTAIHVRLVDQHDNSSDADMADLTPEERLTMMWQLTRDAWAFTKHPERAESRLQRNVVRAYRRER